MSVGSNGYIVKLPRWKLAIVLVVAAALAAGLFAIGVGLLVVAVPIVAAGILVSRLMSQPSRTRHPPAGPTWHRTIDADYTVVEREISITGRENRSAGSDVKSASQAAQRRQPGDPSPS